MARLYANENFPLAVVEGLRGLGHDVLTTQQTGKSGEAIPDGEVLEWAIGERRAVITLNRRDFIRLHRAKPEHAGIVVCTVDDDFVRQAARIHETIVNLPKLDSLLIRINRPPG